MGLSAVIQNAVNKAFTALGDLKETVTYYTKASTSASYDTTTGGITNTESSHSLSGIVASYQEREVDGQIIRWGDMQFIFPAADLTVTPKLNDYLTRADGTRWEVIGKKTDPAGATWTLQIRRQ